MLLFVLRSAHPLAVAADSLITHPLNPLLRQAISEPLFKGRAVEISMETFRCTQRGYPLYPPTPAGAPPSAAAAASSEDDYASPSSASSPPPPPPAPALSGAGWARQPAPGENIPSLGGGPEGYPGAGKAGNIPVRLFYNELSTLAHVTGEDAIRHLMSRGYVHIHGYPWV